MNNGDLNSISSVEIVVSRNFILSNNITFNERIGLGSKFPSSEENFFCADIFDNGGKAGHFPEFLLMHEYINRKDVHYNNKFILIAKGMFCRRYGGLMGFLILLYYFLKCLHISRSIKLSINLFYGYKNLRKIIKKIDE